MELYEKRVIESVNFNLQEKLVYLLIKNLIVKKIENQEVVISNTNERVTLPKYVDLNFLKECERSDSTIDLINYYWSTL